MINNVKLEVKIDYSQPIELSSLTCALNSLSSLYQELNNNDKNVRLFIKEIKSRLALNASNEAIKVQAEEIKNVIMAKINAQPENTRNLGM